jgi:hypothetical protein
MGNKWWSRRGARFAQLLLQLTVAIFGFVVHAANFQVHNSHEQGESGRKPQMVADGSRTDATGIFTGGNGGHGRTAIAVIGGKGGDGGNGGTNYAPFAPFAPQRHRAR